MAELHCHLNWRPPVFGSGSELCLICCDLAQQISGGGGGESYDRCGCSIEYPVPPPVRPSPTKHHVKSLTPPECNVQQAIGPANKLQ